MPQATVFIGFMGSGKSTAARELAARLGVDAIDSDVELERRLGHSIAEEWDAAGEAAFRALEERVLIEMLARAPQGTVIALGGGSVLSQRVREALAADHLTALLDIDAASAWERVQERGSERPLARSKAAFAELHAERAPLYESIADAVLPAGVEEVAVKALPGLRALTTAPAGTRMVWASAASGEYPVLLGAGLLTAPSGQAPPGSGPVAPGSGPVAPGSGPVAPGSGPVAPGSGPVAPGPGAAAAAAWWPGETLDAGKAPAWWPLPRERSRAFCVTDANVAPLYGGAVQPVEALIAIEPGESHKTLATAELVWGRLLDAGMTRADHIVALGGGVVGDLAGFCAATYQRGVPVVQVPTTLVAQVDSAYGGKTGVDLPAGKNYVGAYHQPAAVIVDPGTLATLPPRELAAGWVEVLKTAMIAGGPLWQRVAGGDSARNGAGGGRAAREHGAAGEEPRLPVDADTIFACARTKLAVVAADERDSGARQALNLGHTIGHAIEVASGYGRYLHGEAVGLGLLGALRLAGASELRGEVERMLADRGLPTRLAGVAASDVVAATWHDKKRLGRAAVPFVLARAPGELEIGVQVAERDVAAAVAELCG